MKQLFLIVLCTISILFVGAQSQTITGTLLPKKGESVTYLPKASEVQKSDNSNVEPKQQEIIVNKTNVKKAIHSGNEKPLVKTKVPAAKSPIPKGFVFNLPVVQGTNSTQTTTPVTTLFTEESKPTAAIIDKPDVVIAAQSQVVANNLVTSTTKKPETEPLKYEEPPTGPSAWSAPPASAETAKLEPLVYGPPPTQFESISSNNTASDKKPSLRSPKFTGTYKPTLKKPILMAPMSSDDMDNGVPKMKETEPIANVVEKPKSVEDLYPPLNYTVPTSAAAAGLRSPKIEGAYVASKNNSMILLPEPQNSKNGQQQNGNILLHQEPPVQLPSNNNSNFNAIKSEQVASDPNIFDENYRAKPTTTSTPIYTKYKKATPKVTSRKRLNKLVPNKTYQPIQQPTKAKPINNFKKTFLKPVRQGISNGSTSFKQQQFNILITSILA